MFLEEKQKLCSWKSSQIEIDANFSQILKLLKKKVLRKMHKQIIKASPAGNFSNFLFYIAILFLNKHMTHESCRS